MDIEAPFEANAQLAEGGKPGMRAFDNPTMLAEATVLLDATACDSWVDAPLAQMPTTPREVSVKLVGAASRSAGQAWQRGYCIDQVFEDNRIVPIGPAHGQRQRKAAPVYDEMTLRRDASTTHRP